MVCSKNAPWPGRKRFQRVIYRLLPAGQKEETKLSCLLLEGTGPLVRSARLPDHGVREMPLAWQVATRVSKAQEIGLLRIQ